jgi:hypothetical protein
MLLVGRSPEARLLSTHCDSPSCRSPRCPHYRPLRMVDGYDAGVVQKRGNIVRCADDNCCLTPAESTGCSGWHQSVAPDPCRQISPTLFAALDHLGMLHCSFCRSSGRSLARSRRSKRGPEWDPRRGAESVDPVGPPVPLAWWICSPHDLESML